MTKEQEYIDRINARENIEFVRWDGEFKGAKGRAVVRCKIDGYEWSTIIHNLTKTNPRGCPHCSGKRRWTADEQIGRINARENIEFVRWDGEYKNVHSKAIVRCKIDGYEWSNAVAQLITTNPTGCPQCSGNRRWTADEQIGRINARENIEFVRWYDKFENSKSKAIVRCKIDGYEWSAKVSALTCAVLSGCPHCSGKRRWTADEYIDRINARENIEFARWDGEFKGTQGKAIVRCKIDGYEWSAKVADLTKPNPTGCPYCTRYGKTEEQPAPNVTVEIPTDVKPAFDLLNWQRTKKDPAGVAG